jgi:hypothetical protein
MDKRDLQNLDQSIKDRIMSVETQPPTNIRRRYQSDGKRQIEKSRSKPMAIKVYRSFFSDSQLYFISFSYQIYNVVH